MVQPDDFDMVCRLGAAVLCGAGEIKFAFIATAMAVLLADMVIDPLVAKRRGTSASPKDAKSE